MVEIRPLNAKSSEEISFMTANKVAIKDSFYKDEILRRKVKMWRDEPMISIASYASARLWDGKPLRYSWYA